MADPLSVAASIEGIATAGIQISIKVVTLAGQVSTASERISAIGNDISLTSGILHQLGELTNQKTSYGDHSVFSKEGLETTKTSAEVCRRIFEQVERETANASEFIRGKHRLGEKVKLSIIERAKWPFLQPGIDLLRTDLREAKGTLMLMLQIASLALSSHMSKQLADINARSSIEAENEYRVHSIYILQQQHLHQHQQEKNLQEQTPSSSSMGKSDLVADQASKDVRGYGSSYQASDLMANALTSNSKGEISIERAGTRQKTKRGESTVKSEKEDISGSDGEFTPIGILTPKTQSVVDTHDLDKARESLMGDQAPPNHNAMENPKKSPLTKATKLHRCSFDPFVTALPTRIKIEWFRSDLQVSESEIHERLMKAQSHEHPSVSDILETLHPYERQLVSADIESVKSGFLSHKVTLLDLKRTEQDLQQGNMTFKAIPSFHFIVQIENPSSSQPYDGRRVMDVSRPTYVKSHVDHISPQCLDDYQLPWKYDEHNPSYIIIKRWIPEGDQNILFEYTRRLREEKEMKDAPRMNKHMEDPATSLKKEQDQLLLMKKRESTVSERASSPTKRQDWADDDPHLISSWRGEPGSHASHDEPPDVEDERPAKSESEDGESLDEDSSAEDWTPDTELNAVNELLRKYTTVFKEVEAKERAQSPMISV